MLCSQSLVHLIPHPDLSPTYTLAAATIGNGCAMISSYWWRYWSLPLSSLQFIILSTGIRLAARCVIMLKDEGISIPQSSPVVDPLGWATVDEQLLMWKTKFGCNFYLDLCFFLRKPRHQQPNFHALICRFQRLPKRTPPSAAKSWSVDMSSAVVLYFSVLRSCSARYFPQGPHCPQQLALQIWSRHLELPHETALTESTFQSALTSRVSLIFNAASSTACVTEASTILHAILRVSSFKGIELGHAVLERDTLRMTERLKITRAWAPKISMRQMLVKTIWCLEVCSVHLRKKHKSR